VAIFKTLNQTSPLRSMVPIVNELGVGLSILDHTYFDTVLSFASIRLNTAVRSIAMVNRPLQKSILGSSADSIFWIRHDVCAGTSGGMAQS